MSVGGWKRLYDLVMNLGPSSQRHASTPSEGRKYRSRVRATRPDPQSKETKIPEEDLKKT